MSTVGLDASVLVRVLTDEPEKLAMTARERILRGLAEGGVFVLSDLCVAEAYFVLHKIYGIPKKASLAALGDLFKQPGFCAERDGVAPSVLAEQWIHPSTKPGFVERMIHSRYLQRCDRMLTFEKASGKLDKVEVL